MNGTSGCLLKSTNIQPQGRGREHPFPLYAKVNAWVKVTATSVYNAFRKCDINIAMEIERKKGREGGDADLGEALLAKCV